MAFLAITLSALIGQAPAAEAPQPPTGSYLLRVERALELVRADLPAMAETVERAADQLAAGGKFWATGQPPLISEFTGRAGGFMMLRDGRDKELAPADLVLHFEGVDCPVPEAPAQIVVIGDAPAASGRINSHAAEAGLSPTLANAVAGWVFTGELIAALTRRDRMPVIYESIGAYGGNARMQQYQNGEIAWHDDTVKVPPCAPSVIGNQFADTIIAMLRRIGNQERSRIEQAGAWIRQARQAGGKSLFMYSMGHLFPDEIEKTEIGSVFRSAVWNAGFRMPHPEEIYAEGEVAIHIGYQHSPRVLLERATAAGAKVVYVSVMQDRNFTGRQDVIWLDPMWDWPDACVPLPGYDVPLLAASGVVNGALAWELYRLSQ